MVALDLAARHRPRNAQIATMLSQTFAAEERPRSIVLATDSFGLDVWSYGGGSGAYADQAGTIITRWTSMWERPEIWLFDLHRHLLAGSTGEMLVGILGLIGIGFVVSGTLLWWRTRRTFEFRLWPKRLSIPAILRHHRDLGIIAAPLLLILFVTGAMMALPPVESLLLRPFASPAELAAARQNPQAIWPPLADRLDWHRIMETTRQRFPEAEIRVVTLPSSAGAPITVRVRQPGEYLPKGSTRLWFNPANGDRIGERDVRDLTFGTRLITLEYPLHAGKIGTLAWRIALTLAGLALTMLGALTFLTFWRNELRPKPAKRRK